MKQNQVTGVAQRGLVALAVTGLLVIGFAAGPASADPPTEFSVTNTFVALNPCTGLEHEITITLEIREHQGHPNNLTGRASRTGSTSDGFVMNHGVEHLQVNGNTVSNGFTDQWRHPDGSKFKAQGHIVFDQSAGELIVDRFSLTCLGNN